MRLSGRGEIVTEPCFELEIGEELCTISRHFLPTTHVCKMWRRRRSIFSGCGMSQPMAALKQRLVETEIMHG